MLDDGMYAFSPAWGVEIINILLLDWVVFRDCEYIILGFYHCSYLG